MEIKVKEGMAIDDIISSIIPKLIKESKFRLNKDKLRNKLKKLNKCEEVLKETKFLEAHMYRDYSGGTDKLLISFSFKRNEYSTIYRSVIYYNINRHLPIKYIKELIQSIEDDDKIIKQEWLGTVPYSLDKNQKKKVDKLCGILTEILSSGIRVPEYTNLSILDKNGIKITRGDHDSFGWLTAVLHLEKGKLVLG